MSKASDMIREYLEVGGLFNPETMNQTQHDAVRDTLMAARNDILSLEDRIKRLEEAGDKAIMNSYFPDRLAVWNEVRHSQ